MRLDIDPALPLTAQVRKASVEQAGPAKGVLLYRFFDSNSRLLYVGITCQVPGRWQAHKTTAKWWPEVAYVATERHPHESAALEAERRVIQDENPLHNTRSVPRSFRSHLWNAAGMAPESDPGDSTHRCIGKGRGRDKEGKGRERTLPSRSFIALRSASAGVDE